MKSQRTKAADTGATAAHGAHGAPRGSGRGTEAIGPPPAPTAEHGRTGRAPRRPGTRRKTGGFEALEPRSASRGTSGAPPGPNAKPTPESAPECGLPTERRGESLRLVGYARVSTTGQAEEGVSLEEQERRIRLYADAQGAFLVGIEVDRGLSAKTMARRPGLARALDLLGRREASALVAVKLDRVTRSIRDVIALVERARREGWRLVSLGEQLDTESAMGKFFVHMLGALAELERAQIGERTKAALGELRRQGRRVSGKPRFGYAFRAERVVEVPEEFAVLRRLQKLQAEGLGAKAIATRMNDAKDYNPRTRRPWHHGTVRDVLARAAKQ